MGKFLVVVLALLPFLKSYGECLPSTELAKIGDRIITVSYFKYVEEKIPQWALSKYYKDRYKLLKRIVERTLILEDKERKGFFDKKWVKDRVLRFKVRTLANLYLAKKLSGVTVSEKELIKAARSSSKKELKSLRESILARKVLRERERILKEVSSKIVTLNLNPGRDTVIVARFMGEEVKYYQLKPLIRGKVNEEKVKKALLTYALYKLSLKEGIDKEGRFINYLWSFKEKLAVESFKREILSRVKVSEREVKDFYDKNKDKFLSPGRARVKVFLFSSKGEAEKALKLLRKGVPVDKSVPKEVLRKGKEWLVSSEENSNPISQAVFKDDSKFKLIKTSRGKFLLVYVKELTPPKPLPYGDAYSQVKRELIGRKAEELFRKEIEELKRKYKVTLFMGSLKCIGQEKSF